MILLVSTSSRGRECAAALETGSGHKAQLTTTVPQALERLKIADFDVVAIDQSLLEADPRGLDTLLNGCGTAMPLQINLGLHSCERIVREVQTALQRAAGERRAAEQLAGRVLRNELRNEVTGILLNSELALRQQGLAPQIAAKLQSVRESAERMRTRLEIH
jgi:hypothetical protein